MKPLLWKEMHDLRGWLLAGFAVTGAVELLLLTKVFDPSFIAGWMIVLMPSPPPYWRSGWRGTNRQRTPQQDAGFSAGAAGFPGCHRVVEVYCGIGRAGAAHAVHSGFGLYGSPIYVGRDAPAIREQVGMGQLLVTLLPRFWFIYALALFFSVLVDRSVKAAALAGVVAITLAAVVAKFADLAPFSGFVYWLPCFDGTGGLVDAPEASGFGMTGLAYSAGALLVTAASARLLQRSPERVLGNRASRWRQPL